MITDPQHLQFVLNHGTQLLSKENYYREIWPDLDLDIPDTIIDALAAFPKVASDASRDRIQQMVGKWLIEEFANAAYVLGCLEYNYHQDDLPPPQHESSPPSQKIISLKTVDGENVG